MALCQRFVDFAQTFHCLSFIGKETQLIVNSFEFLHFFGSNGVAIEIAFGFHREIAGASEWGEKERSFYAIDSKAVDLASCGCLLPLTSFMKRRGRCLFFVVAKNSIQLSGLAVLTCQDEILDLQKQATRTTRLFYASTVRNKPTPTPPTILS